MPAIQTTALTKRYKELTAVDTLDLQIQKGGLYALLGVNGPGKTTARVNAMLKQQQNTA